MIRSMTAFAHGERHGDWGGLIVELRSVNHRYLEVFMRLPEELRPLESAMRERIGQRLSRGKVDCSVRFQSEGGSHGELRVNRDLAAKLAHAAREVDAVLYNPAPISSLEVLKWPGVLETPAPNPDVLRDETLALLDEVLQELAECRQREGEKLKAVIEQRCDAMLKVVRGVRQRLPQLLERLRERLRGRLAEIKADVNEDRLEQEMVLIAQKMDVDEELDRLQVHVEEVRRLLDEDKPVGRRLDFLMQELNREANTLGAKAADTDTTSASVDLKVLIEQAREQIQNIE